MLFCREWLTQLLVYLPPGAHVGFVTQIGDEAKLLIQVDGGQATDQCVQQGSLVTKVEQTLADGRKERFGKPSSLCFRNDKHPIVFAVFLIGEMFKPGRRCADRLTVLVAQKRLSLW